MRILLFYDNLIRDFRGLLYLQEILRRRGHRVRVAPLWHRPKDDIREMNPHTVVLGQMGEQTTFDVGRFAIDRGMNLVLNTTENVAFEHRKQYFFKVNFREWNEPYIDLQVIISRDFDDYIRNHNEIANKAKYHFIGCPRFDLSVNPEICLNETRHVQRKYNLDQYSRIVLYISSFIFDEAGGQASRENSDFINVPKRLEQELAQKAQHHDILKRLAERMASEGGVLMIKRHPWDKSNYYQDHYSGLPVVLVDHHDYIVPLLQVSEAVIHTESTVAIEGWIQRKKTISLLPEFDGDRGCLKNHMTHEPIARTYGEVEALLADYPWERTERSLENYTPYIDGRATQRLADRIEALPVKPTWRGFDTAPAERAAIRQKFIEERQLTATYLNQLPRDSYDYRHRYLDQFRREIESLYQDPIRRFTIAPAAPTSNGIRTDGEQEGEIGAIYANPALTAIEDRIVLGEFAEALSDLKTMGASGDDSANRHYLMGRARVGLAEWEAASRSWEQAVALSPEHVEWRYQLADLYADQLPNMDAAFGHCKAILDQRPDHVKTLWLLARIIMHSDQPDRARSFIDAILEIEPAHREARQWVAAQTVPTPSTGSEFESIAADPDLANIRRRADQQRMGAWRVHFNGLRIHCHDLAAFYIAAKDIFLHRIYDFEAGSDAPEVIDGGGHIGLFALFVKQKYPKSRVTVFEPDADAVRLLRRNLDANGMGDVRIVEKGLLDREGDVAFEPDGSDGGTLFGEKTTHAVPVTRLGAYLDRKIDLLKLNIEGAEDAVIQDIAPRLSMVQTVVIEYHGFPELGQTLHRILRTLDTAGFRYLIHDFDAQTNPATKPPFRLADDTRFFLIIYARQVPRGRVIHPQVGDDTQTGRDAQTTGIQAFYWNEFYRRHAGTLRGRVLVVGAPEFADHAAFQPGTAIDEVAFMPADALDERTTDPPGEWDCIIHFQLPKAAAACTRLLQQYRAMLSEDGIFLVWNRGILPGTESDGRAMTDRALTNIIQTACPDAAIQVEGFGNVSAANAWLDGKLAMALPDAILRWEDPDYPIVVGAHVRPAGPARDRHEAPDPGAKKRVLVYTLWRSGTHWLANMIGDMLGMTWTYSDGPHPAKDVFDALGDGDIAVRHLSDSPAMVMRWAEAMDFDVVFLSRDPKDVIASTVNMRKHVEGQRSGLPVFSDMAVDEVLEWDLTAYAGHYTELLQEWHNLRHPRCHHIAYEDLVTAPEKTMWGLARYFRLDVDPHALSQIIEAYRFEKVSGRVKGEENKASHYRKGVIGDWQNQFDSADVDRIEAMFDDFPYSEPYERHLSVDPISRSFGFDRGQPIDRLYMERFLENHRTDIRGRVLEIADNAYTRQFGEAVTQSDILHVEQAPNATLVGDLTTGVNIPDGVFDCIVLTQTLNVVFDVEATLTHAYRALTPGGVLLITVPGLSQVSRYDMDRWGDYWRFNASDLSALIEAAAPNCQWDITVYGNRAVAGAFLDGRAVAELTDEQLAGLDPRFSILLGATVRKPESAKDAIMPSNGGSPALQRVPPTVLLYHRIADPPLDPQLLCVHADRFEAHLAQLADRYNVIPLSDMADMVRQESLEPDSIALTFDDGYADNLTHAVPILEKFGMHATIFITAGAIESQQPFWWDALASFLLETPETPEWLDISHSNCQGRWHLGSLSGRLAAYHDISRRLRPLPVQAIDAVIREMASQAGQGGTAPTAPILSVDGLKQLAASPAIEIGAHTMSHPRLASLSDADQMTEIYLAKRRLEEMLDTRVRLFSYPFGAPGDFNGASMTLAEAAGYDAAVSNVQGRVHRGANRFAIPRILVRNWTGDRFGQWLAGENTDALEAETVGARDERLVSHMETIHSQIA